MKKKFLIEREMDCSVQFIGRSIPKLRLLVNAGYRQVAFAVMLLSISVAGCGKDTTLHPISGKVTMGGKSYYRLLVYFRPISGEVDQYNLGVGETDATGVLTLRSTAGDGLVAGKYRVSFSLLVVPGSDEAVDPNVKRERRQDRPAIEKVPAQYADAEQSPVTFEVTSGGSNYFEFDVPEDAS
jgi:hypothetical protein